MKTLLVLVRALWQEDSGQDLIEYTLLLAFVSLCSALLFTSTGSNVSKIWCTANTTLSTAAIKAGS